MPCCVPCTGEGVLMFFGKTSFRAGQWCGVALTEPNVRQFFTFKLQSIGMFQEFFFLSLNEYLMRKFFKPSHSHIHTLTQGDSDGTVGGKQYFTCAPNHGVFVLPDRIVLTAPLPSPHTAGTL